MKDDMQVHMSTYQALAAGDYIEAVDTLGNHMQGNVEITSPDHGVVWIHTLAGERKLLNVQEHKIYAVNAYSPHMRV